MRSSASTPNRSRSPRPIRLFVVLAGEDHPKACTGRRLLRWGRATSAPTHSPAGEAPVTLDPYAPTPLSAADRATVERLGLLAVDCSWNRLGERGRFPDATVGPGRRARRRRLPILIATNPQHYGRVAQLNTAEALAGALGVLGRMAEASRLLAGLAGGEEFVAVNRDRLERYAGAGSAEEILAAERALFGGG